MPHNKPHQFLFSIVTAAYNAAPWLDEMLLSLEAQSLSFKDNIQVILVDDGSTDETHAIATKWVQRYPNNIKVICKENGGPASARNAGLAHVQGQWVGFIDADDMVATDYFAAVYNFLIESQYDGSLIACNTLLYEEESKVIINGHPLAYKFQNTRIVDLLTEPLYIQLFANACFFKTDVLLNSQCVFDSRIRPTFEDAHFLNIFLLHVRDFRIAFLKNAHYLYRRRGEGTGLVGGSWQAPAKYREQIMYGYLDLVKAYQKQLGSVPDFIQNMVVYESQWYMERLLDGGISKVLDSAGWDMFFDLMKLLFSHIDARNILLSQLPMLGMKIRIAMLGAFKDAEYFTAPFFVSEIAPSGEEACVLHWSTCKETNNNPSKESTPVYRLQDAKGRKIIITWGEERIFYFATRPFLREYKFTLKLKQLLPLHFEVNDEQTAVICGGFVHETLDKQTIIECARFFSKLKTRPV